jgi:hypothetical protein
MAGYFAVRFSRPAGGLACVESIEDDEDVRIMPQEIP